MGHEDSFSYFVFSCFGIKDWLSCSFTVNFGRVDKNMLSRRKETKQIKHSKNEENFQVFSHRGYTWHLNDLMATKLLSLKLFFDLAQLLAAMCPISDSEVPFPVLVRGACPRKTNHILSSPFTVALATGWERFQTTSNPSFSTK